MAVRIVVIDTDVLVSTAGNPDKKFVVWEAVRAGRLLPVATESALRELQEVADRSKVKAALPKLQANFPLFLIECRRYARIISEPPPRFVLHADPKDSFLFNIAIASQAQAIVSFDTTHVLPLADPAHPQHSVLNSLAPGLKLLHPRELARVLVLQHPKDLPANH